jgi:inner membrane protein
MSTSSSPGFFEKFNNWISGSITIRILSITILVLLLLIPNAMIQDIISERQHTSERASREISQIWGHEQTICGPVISIPYIVRHVTDDGKVYTTEHWSHFLPDELTITGNVDSEIRHKSIYETAVYHTDLGISGSFKRPDPAEIGIDSIDFKFDNAIISVGIPDMRGIKEKVELQLGVKKYEFGPGVPTADIISEGISVPIELDSSANFDFHFNLSLNGSSSLNFIPMGKETDVSLISPWPDPGFIGDHAAVHNINEGGFTASWKVLDLNRNFPQAWKGQQHDIFGSSFGVELVIPLDHYQQSMRSAKYAIMFISLTFLVFFFIETINRKRIHPIQYILVGLALSLFFVLLLSLSEHIGFNGAFISAACATTGLITIYSGGMLQNKKLTSLMFGLLTALYTFIYTILQLEDMALLAGSIGLFLVLAAIMFWSRKVDWYEYGNTSVGE